MEDDIRDDDLGVELVLEPKYKESLALTRRCPMKTWNRLANFAPFEAQYQEVKNSW